MRPRKRVLVFCAEEELAGRLRFRMQLRHAITVTVVHTKRELVRALMEPEPWRGMVHVVSPNSPNEEIAALMATADGETARVEVRPLRKRELYPTLSTAQRVIWTQDAMDACPGIDIAMARKRGPKRQAGCPFPAALA